MKKEIFADLYTEEGENLPEIPWNTYPRPQMKRDSYFSLCGEWELYIKNKNEFIKYNVTKSSVFKQFVILELKEIDDMDKAIALKNITLYADREDFSLEDGEYFLTDIIGLDVIDADNGKIYGKVSDIINRGASDIYVVDTPNGERMIPAVEEFIVEIDINCGIKVRTIEGLLD